MLAREAQNQSQIDSYQRMGPYQLGPWTSHIARSDPRHLAFLLTRYKFCAKMLSGKRNVLEVGCGDGFGLPLVLQTVGAVHGVDFEPVVLEDTAGRMEREGVQNVSFAVQDLTLSSPDGRFDAAYALDVIEHISPESESAFMANICRSLDEHAVIIIGTPNVAAEKYASAASREGHVNLKSADSLKALVEEFFHNTFNFSVNDEVVHTGFSGMAHYILCMGVGVKN